MSETHRTSPSSLCIVDNSDEDWKVVNYLQQWTEIARSFDIATGYFEIGALLALDGLWSEGSSVRCRLMVTSSLNLAKLSPLDCQS